MTKERYQIRDGSQSAHCCFEATIVDTNQPVMIGGVHYRDHDGKLQYESVCECFSFADANKICNALNTTEMP